MQVYLWSEVVGFCHVFYLPQYKQNPSDHARMEKMIQPSVDRFKALDEEHREAFYEKITAYTSFYSFISQIIPYSDQELEMLYSFGRYLIPHLDLQEESVNPHPEKEVILQYYRIEQTMSGSIMMEGGDQYGVKSPTAVGTGKAKDEDKPLSEIIQALNDRFGTDFPMRIGSFLNRLKKRPQKTNELSRPQKPTPWINLNLASRPSSNP